MRIDCQTHIFPVEYAEVLTPKSEWPRTVLEADQFVLTYKDAQTFVMGREAYGVTRKLRAMDAVSIDISALSVNMPGPENLAPELAVPAARAGNDALAEAVAQHPDRFVGLACLPWQSTEDALAELERAVGTLGHRGVMLYSHIVGVEVDDVALDPLYQRIAELGVPVVLHPSVPPWGEAIKHHSMIPHGGFDGASEFCHLAVDFGRRPRTPSPTQGRAAALRRRAAVSVGTRRAPDRDLAPGPGADQPACRQVLRTSLFRRSLPRGRQH